MWEGVRYGEREGEGGHRCRAEGREGKDVAEISVLVLIVSLLNA